MLTIPCISLRQPWATLMAIGAKHIETRSWAPRASDLAAGGLLGIHAAKTDEHIKGMSLGQVRSMLDGADHPAPTDPIELALRAAGYSQIGTMRARRSPYGNDDVYLRVRWNVPLGGVVAVLRYVGARKVIGLLHDAQRGAIPIVGSHPADLGEPIGNPERAFGDYLPGRVCWFTELVLRLDPPVPQHGVQGIWRWRLPEDVERQLRTGGCLT